MTKLIFVTGGVVSSLGKGVASASLGAVLKARNLKINLIKLDPYINVDPGTMNPVQHGEVFVTEDAPKPIWIWAIMNVLPAESCDGITTLPPPNLRFGAETRTGR